MSKDLALPRAEDTESLGRDLARTRPQRAVVYLEGELGAGKSTLARALLRALGVSGPIKSPTYTLVERYGLDEGEAAHLDLYRIAEAGELDFLALDELAGEARLWLIEWPDRGRSGLPPADLRVRLTMVGEGRRAELSPESPTGRAWLADFSKIAAPRASS